MSSWLVPSRAVNLAPEPKHYPPIIIIIITTTTPGLSASAAR